MQQKIHAVTTLSAKKKWLIVTPKVAFAIETIEEGVNNEDTTTTPLACNFVKKRFQHKVSLWNSRNS